MKKIFTYHPYYFFLSSLGMASIFWFAAAYISYYQQSVSYLLFPLILAGMASPTISAMIVFLTSRDKELWNDFCQRLRFDKINIRFIPFTLVCMPCLVLLSIAISLLFGFSPAQFSLAALSTEQALEGKSLLAIVAIVLLSCSLEEIGWRGYGVDSLNSKFNFWKTSLIFASLWSLWHVPAFFIKNGYFQQEVWNLGIVYVITYFMSLFPITILINWLYSKNNRSILVAILFHTVMNLSFGLLQIQPFTRIILMFLLLIVAGIIVMRDKEVFFSNKE